MGNTPSLRSKWIDIIKAQLRMYQHILHECCTTTTCSFTIYNNNKIASLPLWYGDDRTFNVVQYDRNGEMLVSAKEYLRLVLGYPVHESVFSDWAQHTLYILCHIYRYHCLELFTYLSASQFTTCKTQLRQFYEIVDSKHKTDLLATLNWVDQQEFRPINSFNYRIRVR